MFNHYILASPISGKLPSISTPGSSCFSLSPCRRSSWFSQRNGNSDSKLSAIPSGNLLPPLQKQGNELHAHTIIMAILTTLTETSRMLLQTDGASGGADRASGEAPLLLLQLKNKKKTPPTKRK